MLNSLINILLLFYILTVATGSGLLVYRWLRLKTNLQLEVLVLSAGFGILALIYGTAAMAWMDWLIPTAVYGWLIFLSTIAVFGFLTWKRSPGRYLFVDQRENQDGMAKISPWLLLALGVICFAYLLSTMAPPLDGDTLHSYLDVPRRYVNAGGIVLLNFEPLVSQPMNIHMLSVFAMLVRGDELAQMLVGFSMTMGAAVAVYLIGRRYFSVEIGLWAALLFLTTYVVAFLVPSTKVNPGRACFDLLGIYAVSRWAFAEERQNRWLLVAGLFCGAGFGSQYPAGFVVAVMALLICITVAAKEKNFLNSVKSLSGKLMIYGLPVVLLSGPWLIKNYIETGNPVYPVLNHLFIGQDFSLPQHSKNSWSVLATIWDISTGFTARSYGKPIGPMFLSLLPGLLLLRPLPRQINWTLLTLAILYLLWYYAGVQRPRHFLAEIGLLAVVGAWVLVASKRRYSWVRRVAVFSFALLFVFEMAFFARLHFISFDKLRYVSGTVTRDDFLKNGLNLYDAYLNWDMVNYINKLPKKKTTIVSLYLGNDYYIDPDISFIDSRMTDGCFYNPVLADQQLILEEWQRLGVSHLFVNEQYLKGKEVGNSADYMLVQSAAFKKDCLALVKKSGQQYLYRFTCDKASYSIKNKPT